MQKTIIKNPMPGSWPPGIQRQKKTHKEEKIEGEKKKKKENYSDGREKQVLGQLGAIEGHRYNYKPPVDYICADEYSFPRAILNQISHE